MIVVVQCASRKIESAGTFRHEGRPVEFVAHPSLQQSSEVLHAHPDDRIPGGEGTWRDLVMDTNRRKQNPDDLALAADLYDAPAYRALRQSLPLDRIYILSAGWGLVRGDFWLPRYDITFSPQAPKTFRRTPGDSFLDFNQLALADLPPGEVIHFFGGTSYLPLFLNMTNFVAPRIILHFKSKTTAIPPSYEGRQYQKPGNTNWHYGALQDFLKEECEV